MNIFCQNLDSILQNAICRRPCTFHLAILTEFLYLAYFKQGSVFLGHPVDMTVGLRVKTLLSLRLTIVRLNGRTVVPSFVSFRLTQLTSPCKAP